MMSTPDPEALWDGEPLPTAHERPRDHYEADPAARATLERAQAVLRERAAVRRQVEAEDPEEHRRAIEEARARPWRRRRAMTCTRCGDRGGRA